MVSIVNLFVMFNQNVHPANKTGELFHKINYFTCIAGLLNVWKEHFPVPAITKTLCYRLFYKCISFCVYVLMMLEISAFLKRDKLNLKQMCDWIVLAVSQPILYTFYLTLHYYKGKLYDLLLCLTVTLKNVCNDEKVERSMIKRSKFYIAAYLALCSATLVLYGIDSIIQVVSSDKTFTTLITIWPDTEDRSKVAAVARVAYYILWWFLIARTSTAYILTIATTICLSHQFKNTQKYFYGLEHIFKEEGSSHHQKEEQYEAAFKIGIQLHADTVWCTQQCQTVFGVVFSGQIVVILTALVGLMVQMVNSERTIVNAVAIVTTASALLVTTGVSMWNAGDVAVEASNLATAMYSSGWQHCERAAALRLRTLLVVAMTQAQKPVIIRGCGIVEMSYQSYLTIVKSSYSVFSLLY